MLKKDYVAESVLGDSQQAVAAQSIATYLESVTQMVGGAVRGADSSNFTDNSAKIQGYKSIARQIRDTSGAKTAINPELLFDKVTLPDGEVFRNAKRIETTARQTIKSQLDSVRTQLDTLARSQAFTSNYLTTQIQAINKGVKEGYAAEAQNFISEGRSANFDNLNTLIARSTGSLAQIEDGKLNDTDALNSKRPPAERFILGTHGESITITQEEKTDKGIETYTLTFEEEIGDYFVIGSEAQRGQTILGTDINDNPIMFADYANYRKSAPTIKILATSKKDDKGNVLQIILSNPGLVIISTQFVDNKTYLPVAKGGYTKQTGTQLRPLDPIKWVTDPEQPFTASIDANQETATATISTKRTRVYDIEYNSSTSRFEYSITQDPPKGAKIVQAYITNFTHEAQWTDADGIKTLGKTRFQINNHDT